MSRMLDFDHYQYLGLYVIVGDILYSIMSSYFVPVVWIRLSCSFQRLSFTEHLTLLDSTFIFNRFTFPSTFTLNFLLNSFLLS